VVPVVRLERLGRELSIGNGRAVVLLTTGEAALAMPWPGFG